MCPIDLMTMSEYVYTVDFIKALPEYFPPLKPDLSPIEVSDSFDTDFNATRFRPQTSYTSS